MSGGKLDKSITHNEQSNVIKHQHEAEFHQPDTASWAFKGMIPEHQGLLNPSDRCYKDSSYNVLVHWEDGSEAFEPLSVVTKNILSQHAVQSSMPRTMTFLTSQDGNHSSKLPPLTLLNLLGCVNRPSPIPNNKVLPTSLVSSFRKSWLVAGGGGHMTPPPKDYTVCSAGVVTLRSLRLCSMFLRELNCLRVDAADVLLVPSFEIIIYSSSSRV
jgi:hypothetical protein